MLHLPLARAVAMEHEVADQDVGEEVQPVEHDGERERLGRADAVGGERGEHRRLEDPDSSGGGGEDEREIHGDRDEHRGAKAHL